MSNWCRDGGRLLTPGTSRISCLGLRFQTAAHIWGKCHDHHGESGISSDWKENGFLLKVCVPSQHFCLLLYFFFPWVEMEWWEKAGCCSADSTLVCHLGQYMSCLGGWPGHVPGALPWLEDLKPGQ